MDRTVIAVWKPGPRKKYRFWLFNSPEGPTGLGDTELTYTRKLVDDLGQPEINADLVKKVGTMLYKALQKDEKVKRALDAIARSSARNPAPVYFYFDQVESEALPWETLCDANGAYLSLNEHMPVARIPVAPIKDVTITRTFQLPCRLFAVLSAAQVSAKSEWEALFGAVKRARFPITMRVLVGEKALLDEISTLVTTPDIVIRNLDRAPESPIPGPAGNGGAGLAVTPRVVIEVGYLDGSATRLIEHIQTYNPQLLHFFCHGYSKPEPHLRLATKADWKTDAPEGSVSVAPLQFQPLQIPSTEISIVALNCCKSSSGEGEVNSLAMSLVKQGIGFPAVVGMREPVSSHDANLFTESFYGSIFGRVQDFVDQKSSLEDIDWVGAMCIPRSRLIEARGNRVTIQQAAANVKEWTLPVIYIRPEPFKHRLALPVSADEQDQLRLTALLDALREVRSLNVDNAQAPSTLLSSLSNEITALEAQLSG